MPEYTITITIQAEDEIEAHNYAAAIVLPEPYINMRVDEVQ